MAAEGMLEVNQCVHLFFGKRWFVLIVWQLMSMLLTAINVINTLLADRNGSTLPLLQLCITYSLLLFTHVWRFERSEISWIPYLIVSVFNFVGDTTAIVAYNTTSLSSAMLLTTTVVFWVTPLSFFFLKRKYSLVQLFSIAFGFCGVILVFVADGVGDSKWVGNLCSFMSALAYAIANILQEKLVYSASVTLYLCRFSLFTAPISAACSGIFEHKTIRDYNWNTASFLFIFGYSILLAVYYTGIPFVMQFSNATEMNISLLSANFFSLLISIVAFGQKAEWLYLVGFFFIPISITLYTLFPYKEKKTELSTGINDNIENSTSNAKNNANAQNREENVDFEGVYETSSTSKTNSTDYSDSDSSKSKSKEQSQT
ncbi:Integral membrane protein [Tritrichomonas foetus]|uniref:Integral membrane protein n=1 Tax=Tritrichomonas foetus TaxID=1144522 RepID=A0A1J4J4E0_9EUKA|nr:Integral membrane protein [Tritrichomonas foetus]|eukprot:OHS93585.1 Integral membrane protein [Tritrichomonas foetus]